MSKPKLLNITCLKFFIAVNEPNATVDTPAYEISVNNPVLIDILGEQAEPIKSLTCMKFFIAVNRPNDTVDSPATEISVNDPVLIEFEFYK